MVGSAIVRRLAAENCEVLTVGRDELDLTDDERAALERSAQAVREPMSVISL